MTLTEGYPTRSSEAGGLLKDQFLRPAKSQSRWYGLYSDHKVDSSNVNTWSTDASKLNSYFSRITRQSGLLPPPASRHLSQETLRKWEKSSREATVFCNQAASFNHCLFKVQQNMQEQMKTIRSESKGKGSAKVSSALDELQFLMDFNASITQAAAKTMEHLSDFAFISMLNLTLAHRDSYLNHVKGGVKPDTIAALRNAPLHIPTLFPDSIIKRAEEEIAPLRPKDSLAQGVSVGTTHMSVQRKGQTKGQLQRVIDPLGRTLGKVATKNQRGSPPAIHRDQPRAISPINDNYCIDRLQRGLLAGSQISTRQTLDTCQSLNVNSHVVQAVHSAPGHSQKRELSPGSAGCYFRNHKLKYVKSVSCVTQLSCVNPVTNVRNAALNLPVGARLQNFWQTWLDLGGRSESCSNLERGLHPPLLEPTKTHKVSHSHKLLC